MNRMSWSNKARKCRISYVSQIHTSKVIKLSFVNKFSETQRNNGRMYDITKNILFTSFKESFLSVGMLFNLIQTKNT